MNEIIVANISNIEARHKHRHEKYEYYVKPLVTEKDAGQCSVSVYEIPPGKAAYPYHYHTMNEETFYILGGTGRLTTPDGDRTVCKGDFLFFPAGEKGAHMLTNISDSEMLVYLDFDTENPIEVAFYPHTGKIGVWGKNIDHVYKTADQTDYYDGEN